MRSFDTLSEAKRYAQFHSENFGQETPAANENGGGTGSYRDAVRATLLKMGSPDASKDVLTAKDLIVRCEAGGISPEVCAGIISGTAHHGHDCNGGGVALQEAPSNVSYSGPSELRAGDVVRVRVMTREGALLENYETIVPTDETGIELADRVARGQPVRVVLYLVRHERGTSEARDSHTSCQPFTKLVRDPDELAACAKRSGKVETSRDLYELVNPYLSKADQEKFIVVCIDFRGQVRDYVEVAQGQRNRVAVDVEDILRPVILSGCNGFAVCHNHPSGVAEPSDADGKLTENIRKAASVACPSVRLVDHLVIGNGQFFSFADHDWKHRGRVTKV
jgi:hypothetical protein